VLTEEQIKIRELEAQLNTEQKKVRKLTDQLNVLQSPMESEIVTIAELTAVPENYIGKEVIVEGVAIPGTLTMNDSIAHFRLR